MGRRLVVASNRGPVTWRPSDTGEMTPTRGFGGLVTALGGALQREEGTWVSVALSDTDLAVAFEHAGEPFDVEVSGGRYTLRLLDAGDRFDAYYNRVANRLLWFTVHGMWDEPYDPADSDWHRCWEDAYLPVNRQVGEAVAAAVEPGDEVYLQDYHLCTAAATVRQAVPDVAVLHYMHTPWVGPDELSRLPDRIGEQVLRGLLAADVVAFSSPLWCDAFRRCAVELLGARSDGDAVVLDGRRTAVVDLVLGIDADDLASSAASAETLAAGERLEHRLRGRTLIGRVDRTDLSKNILRGLRAYALLLERHPEHRGRVWHYANLNPSRQDVPAYRAYVDACRAEAARVADRFGADAVELFIGDDYPGAIATLKRADVLLANPIVDGTNLVAKEGPTVNERDAVLVLSRRAGASTVLGDAALLVNPFDVEAQAEALHTALTMDRGERAERARRLREASRIGAPDEWFAAQREALRAAVAARP